MRRNGLLFSQSNYVPTQSWQFNCYFSVFTCCTVSLYRNNFVWIAFFVHRFHIIVVEKNMLFYPEVSKSPQITVQYDIFRHIPIDGKDGDIPILCDRSGGIHTGDFFIP